MIERFLERVISQSRWIMAPFYMGLILSLLVLLYAFVRSSISSPIRRTRAKPT